MKQYEWKDQQNVCTRLRPRTLSPNPSVLSLPLLDEPLSPGWGSKCVGCKCLLWLLCFHASSYRPSSVLHCIGRGCWGRRLGRLGVLDVMLHGESDFRPWEGRALLNVCIWDIISFLPSAFISWLYRPLKPSRTWKQQRTTMTAAVLAETRNCSPQRQFGCLAFGGLCYLACCMPSSHGLGNSKENGQEMLLFRIRMEQLAKNAPRSVTNDFLVSQGKTHTEAWPAFECGLNLWSTSFLRLNTLNRSLFHS